MTQTNFNKRPRPGVDQRHNTSLEHKIVRAYSPKDPKKKRKFPAQPKGLLHTVRELKKEEDKERAFRQLPNQRKLGGS